MSEAQQAVNQTNGAQQRAPRKRRSKAQIAKARAAIAAKKAAAAQANPAPGTVGTIAPTPARAAGMKARGRPVGWKAPVTVGTLSGTVSGPRVLAAASSSIASGFASTLLTAGPSWSADYQKTFMASLTAALPLICAAPITAKAA